MACFLACSLLALGCGPTADGGGTDGGTAGTGGGSSSGGGSGGGSGSQGCGEFSNEDLIGPQVEVVITNPGTEPIYLTDAEDCGSAPLFDLSRDGTPLSWHLGECSFTCQGLVEGLCVCPGACAIDSVLRIDPNGSYVTEWGGQYLEAAELTGACANECGTSCNIRRQSEDGTYTFTVEAGTDFICSDGPCTDECWQRGDGWCRMHGQTAGTTRSASEDLNYPERSSLEVLF